MIDRLAFSRSWALYLVVLAISVGGCDCTTEKPRSLSFVDPACPGEIGLADDVDPDTEGVQVIFTLQSRGLEGEEVSLYLEAATADTDDPIATAVPESDGTVTLTVTLPAGEHNLQARAKDGGVQSDACSLSVDDSCASISFVTPSPPTGAANLTLGPAADEDGEMCGETFETSVVVSTTAEDGQPARVFVNGTARGMVNVSGMLARFTGVALDNRGDVPNTLEVEVERADGVLCREPFPSNIFVDCEGVSCALTLPEPDPDHPGYLNQSYDVDDTEGFQTDFEVSTDAEAVGQNAQLVLDGDADGALERPVTMDGTGGAALFGSVPLTEGLHRVQGICVDSIGNRTRSGIAEWTVDITPCEATIDSIAGGADPITDLDDLDDATDGIQVQMTGTVSGTDCSSVRVGRCSALEPADATGGSFDETITLGSSASQEVCVEVEDAAGNVATVMTTVNVRTDAPQLAIVSPGDGTAYNVDGSGGRTADLDTSTTSCEAALTVNCTDVGVPVEIIRSGPDTVLGTADCVATAGLPSPYAGQASFSMLSIPSVDSGASLSLVARQTVAGLVGLSTPISVESDCHPPTLGLQRPSCDAVLRPSVDDEDTSTTDFEYDVIAINANAPKPPVTLTISNSGGSVVYTDTSSLSPAPTFTSFPLANFGAGGDLTIELCATDGADNTGCFSCGVTVADLPTVTIESPTPPAETMSEDCDTSAAGMQMLVRATTDAPAGSSAEVTIGGGTPISTTVMSGSPNFVEVCTDVSDGRDVVVEVAITTTAGTATATVTVDIDTAPPSSAIDDLSVGVTDRRGGTVTFQWTAVDDTGGFLLDSYELRCADTPITSEADWSAATSRPVTVSPASGGTVQSETVSGFRPGETVYCALRGVDAAGDLTPLASPASIAVSPPFLEQDVTDSGAVALGWSVTAVGDVNGDAVDDVLVGALDSNTAYLYFGSTTGLGASPDVEIAGPTDGRFGAQITTLGDFNGDGRADFAISAPVTNSFAGAVFVFYGRADTDPWPSVIDLPAASGCGADLCLRGAAGSPPTLLGVGTTGLDFNGDGFYDLAIGALRSGGVGRVFIVLGSDGFGPGSDDFTLPGATSADEPAGFRIDPPADVMFFGRSLDSTGDFSGDGLHDLLIGAEGSTSPTVIQGAFMTLAGRPYPSAAVGLSSIASSNVTIVDRGVAGRFGRVVRSLGDYTGDGRLDVAVWEGWASRGDVLVYPGVAGGFSAASSVRYTNDVANRGTDDWGISIAQGHSPWLGVVGDIDGDGLSDLFVGSIERGTAMGTADFYWGSNPLTARPRSDADIIFEPTSTETTGRRVAGYVGDVNGDGFADLAVGEPGYNAGGGRITILY